METIELRIKDEVHLIPVSRIERVLFNSSELCDRCIIYAAGEWFQITGPMAERTYTNLRAIMGKCLEVPGNPKSSFEGAQ